MNLSLLIDPSDAEIRRHLVRPSGNDPAVHDAVCGLLDLVRRDGDAALRSCALRFEGARLDSLFVSEAEIAQASEAIPGELARAILHAKENIERFHAAQLPTGEDVETQPGVRCWRRHVPINSVGLYVPGGKAPLFSTVLMLAIPARLAGCRRVVLATPPAADGSIHPAIAYAASLCNVQTILKAGGAQAIGALAYGTESLAPVDKIFGPGNAYVTHAKQVVASQTCSIDMPAGPSEVMVVADLEADPSFVAADMIAQAEHGADSQAVLVVVDADSVKAMMFVDAVVRELEVQSASNPRSKLLLGSLDHSKAVAVPTARRALDVVNLYAPEHLIVSTADPAWYADRIEHAGSVFLGRWSCESAGDYASGTNHTLPTGGWARSTSGVSVDSFRKQITFQSLSAQGLLGLGPDIMTMACAESLPGHANAVSIRMDHAQKEMAHAIQHS